MHPNYKDNGVLEIEPGFPLLLTFMYETASKCANKHNKLALGETRILCGYYYVVIKLEFVYLNTVVPETTSGV